MSGKDFEGIRKENPVAEFLELLVKSQVRFEKNFRKDFLRNFVNNFRGNSEKAYG